VSQSGVLRAPHVEAAFSKRLEHGARREACLGRKDSGGPALRDEVRCDGRERAGDDGRSGRTLLLDGEVVDETHATTAAVSVRDDALDVRAAGARRNATSPDVLRGEGAG